MENVVHVESLPEHKCAHCNTTIDFGQRVEQLSDTLFFCCHGCKTVYTLIQEKGLAKFYDLTTRLGGKLSPAHPTNKNYSNLDQRATTSTTTTSSTVTLALQGIQCASCVWLLEQLPELTPGVFSAQVRLAQGEITITYNPKITSPSKLATTLDQLGYLPYSPDDAANNKDTHKREELIRIGVASFCSMNIMMLAVSLYQGAYTGIESQYKVFFEWVSLGLSLPVITYCSMPIYRRALSALKTGTLHIDVPIALGLSLSILLSGVNTIIGYGHVYYDSMSAIVFLLLTTRYLQNRTFEKNRRALRGDWRLLPTIAHEVSPTGVITEILQERITQGMILEVQPGERIPCDGVVTKGTSTLDNSCITGESLPELIETGQGVLGGSLNIDSPIQVKAATSAGSSRIEKILHDVEAHLSRDQVFITSLDNLSLLFTSGALLLASGAFIYHLSSGLGAASSAAIAMLTVTCPCAIAFALPLLVIKTVASLGECGILMRSPVTLDKAINITHIFFDKTGTLTKGTLTVYKSYLKEDSELAKKILRALCSIQISHPVSQALLRWAGTGATTALSTTKRIPGFGIEGITEDGRIYRLGSKKWIQQLIPQWTDITTEERAHTTLGAAYLVRDCEVIGTFIVEDEVAPEAIEMVKKLQSYFPHLTTIGILSGDAPHTVQQVANKVGIISHNAYGDLSPEEKASYIKAVQGSVLFVGDGANDAPALAAAAVGVALRGGIQSILECADVFIQNGGISNILKLSSIAHRFNAKARMLVTIGLIYNALGITAAFFGVVTPLLAAIAMPIFSSIVIYLASSAKLYKRA